MKKEVKTAPEKPAKKKEVKAEVKVDPQTVTKPKTTNAIPNKFTTEELCRWLKEHNIVVTDNINEDDGDDQISDNNSIEESDVYAITFDKTLSNQYLNLLDQAAAIQTSIDTLKEVMKKTLIDNKAKVGNLDEKNRVYYKKDSIKRTWNAIKLTQFIAANNGDVEEFKDSKKVKGSYAFPKVRKK